MPQTLERGAEGKGKAVRAPDRLGFLEEVGMSGADADLSIQV